MRIEPHLRDPGSVFGLLAILALGAGCGNKPEMQDPRLSEIVNSASENAALSMHRYQSPDCPIVVDIEYANTTDTTFKFQSTTLQYVSYYLAADILLPDGTSVQTQVRDGSEYINSTNCPYTEIEPGETAKWSYVVTLADIDISGRYLHPRHWSFGPGKYSLRLMTIVRRIHFDHYSLATFSTPTISFEVLIDNGIRAARHKDIRKKFNRLDLTGDFVDQKSFARILDDIGNTDRDKADKALYTASHMTYIDPEHEDLFIRRWHETIEVLDKGMPFSDNSGPMTRLGEIAMIFRKMKTDRAKELLEDHGWKVKGRGVPFIGGG